LIVKHTDIQDQVIWR